MIVFDVSPVNNSDSGEATLYFLCVRWGKEEGSLLNRGGAGESTLIERMSCSRSNFWEDFNSQ